jgi:sugar phosphate isomerase/epimerase
MAGENKNNYHYGAHLFQDKSMRKMTRRQALTALGGLAAATSLQARQSVSRLSVEAYIFQQYATRQKKNLGDVLDEVLEMAHTAGFHDIELNQAFFTADLRERTMALLRAKHLKMPSVYVGGAMHSKESAETTTARALNIARLCQPFGCVAVVNNPEPKAAAAQKTGPELTTQARALNTLGRFLKDDGLELRVHHHTPELVDNAREWRHILHNTDPQYVSFCLDLDWVHQGGLKPLDLLHEAGTRVHEIHVRNSKDKLWLEDLEDGDIDYREIAAYLKRAALKPLLVVELAYRENTLVTRPLAQDLRLSRIYAEQVFGVRA